MSAVENKPEDENKPKAENNTVGDLDNRKLFVGGLSPDTSEQDVKDYFSKFGDIETIRLKTDPFTGNSKGFAFVVFTNNQSLVNAMDGKEHIIKNKKVDVEMARSKPGKLFVSGVSSDLSDEEIKEYFGSFGTIIQADFPFDKTKDVRKSFCFITFETEKPLFEIIKNPKHIIKDKEVYVKKCLNQPKNDQGGFQGQGFNNFNPRRNFGFNRPGNNRFNNGGYQQGNQWQNNSFPNRRMNQGPGQHFNNRSQFQNKNFNSNYNQGNGEGGKWQQQGQQQFQRQRPY